MLCCGFRSLWQMNFFLIIGKTHFKACEMLLRSIEKITKKVAKKVYSILSFRVSPNTPKLRLLMCDLFVEQQLEYSNTCKPAELAL